MEKKIEQEINRTLACLNDNIDIQCNPRFSENLSRKISDIRVSRGLGYRNRAFYPVVIGLLAVLNITAGLVSFTEQEPINNASDNQVSVLASEYGLGHDDYIAF